MSIRWRFAVVVFQLLILLGVSFWLTGRPFAAENWYLAGLLAVVINPQLWEPFYPRPGDVIGNGLIFLFFYGAGRIRGFPSMTAWAWHGAAMIYISAIVLATVGVLLGLSRDESRLKRVGRASRSISQQATARRIYSTVFLLSAIEWRPQMDTHFWLLIGAWVIVVLTGLINWQTLWATAAGSSPPCKIEGNLGPSVLVVSAGELPAPGTWVSISRPGLEAAGVVLSRIRRSTDVWGQIHIAEPEKWERLAAGPSPRITALADPGGDFIGAVGTGSTDKTLSFLATRTLEVGKVVSVGRSEDEASINYQIVSAKVERADIKGCAQLQIKVEAVQLGIFDQEQMRLVRHRWVPPLGAAVTGQGKAVPDALETPLGKLELGRVIGTAIPVYLDIAAACEGHVAILGMTKMGKTSFALRLARALASTNNVTILDQTGEWVNRRGIPPVKSDRDWDSADLSVFEPKPEEIPADRALGMFRYILGKATEEYKTGTPFPRVVIIDEAHQFVPEPAGLGFHAPGRDSSYTIGVLMMQVRKYGLSVILISQRTAVVAKSALSQCENLIAFRNVDQTGLDYLEAVAGGDVRSLLPQLKQGEALVFGPAVSSDSPVAIKVAQEAVNGLAEAEQNLEGCACDGGDSQVTDTQNIISQQEPAE